ncbi:hypothetical protein EMCRGX_G008997 [Ephydatia muelleri]
MNLIKFAQRGSEETGQNRGIARAKQKMGNCMAEMTPEEREARDRSSAIERQLRSEKKDFNRTLKILLLGTGESGKSTIVKQMKIIHGDGYSSEELDTFKHVVYKNLVASMTAIVRNMERLGISFSDPSNSVHADTLQALDSNQDFSTMPPKLAEAIKQLWSDEGVKACFKRAYEYQIEDSASYFFGEMDRLLQSGYVPDEQDVLRSRVQTTGIIETSFRVKKLIYRIVDVGGQRSERSKWIQCFDDVKAVLFVVALNGYDMTLAEDGVTNRMKEALVLFEDICNKQIFARTSMILFLNKVDAFETKILNTDRHLKAFFPEFSGPDHDVDAAKEFIKSQFLACNKSRGKQITPHFTTATNTSNIKVVIDAVIEAIIRENLESIGLIREDE